MAQEYIMHTIGPGDTIQSIGSMYNVDWRDIVTINGLEYPFVDDDFPDYQTGTNDKIATLGSKIVIPTQGISFPYKTNNSSLEIEEYALGCDFDIYFLEESEHHVINLESDGQFADNNNGDLLLAAGLRNLRQQLVTRLGTPKGTLLLHPEYGSDILQYIGKRINEETLTEIGVKLKACILSDFRVKAVSGIRISFEKNYIYVECLIHPQGDFPSFSINHTFAG